MNVCACPPVRDRVHGSSRGRGMTRMTVIRQFVRGIHSLTKGTCKNIKYRLTELELY